MNEVKLIGRLWAKPELKFTSKGTAYIRGLLLVPKNINEKNFIPFTAWGNLAKSFDEVVRENINIQILGSIKSGSYLDSKTGNKKYTLEVLVRDFSVIENEKKINEDFTEIIHDDDIPF